MRKIAGLPVKINLKDSQSNHKYKVDNYYNKVDGVITVYLSLVLLIILSLIFTVIEGARICVARVYAERALSTAMDSIMAEFYGPLWNEYHIFGLDASYGSNDIQEQDISAKLEEYMSYTLYPNRNPRSIHQQKGVELYHTTIDSLEVTDTTLLTDYKGELFLNEAIAYMKYLEIGNALEMFLDKVSLLESPSKVSRIYEEKLKVEEQLVEIDKGILKLMQLLDGIKTSKKGLETTKEGNLITVPTFIKEICFEEITMDSVGINNDIVFFAVKDKYINPQKDFISIDSNLKRLEETLIQIEQKESEMDLLNTELTNAYLALEGFSAEEEGTDENTGKVDDMVKQVQALETKRDALREELKELNEQKQSCMRKIQGKSNELMKEISKLQTLMDDAKKEIHQIQLKVEIAAPLLEAYETTLSKEKDGLEDTIWEGLKENLENLKYYISENGNGYDFATMKRILDYDKSLLERTEDLLEKAIQDLNRLNLNNAKKHFQNAWNTISNYQIKGLTLDYSSLVINQGKKLDLMESIQSSIWGGITGLLIDPNIISTATLPDRTRPSDLYSASQETKDFISDFSSFIRNVFKSNEASNLADLLGSMNQENVDTSWIADSLNAIAETLLFQEYIKDHFEAFPYQQKEAKNRKPSALIYELEYLLSGKKADDKNLSSILSRIIAIRMVANFTSILTDKTICTEAKAAATAIVGFTGLPILITVMQTLILILWSFAEALVDTCALLQGKEVPVIKKEIAMKLSDLLLLTRERIKAKADTLEKPKVLAMSYPDYLSIFLLFSNQSHLIYRSMDLIEENLSLRYYDDFSFQSCLFGFSVEAKISIEPKFTGFQFVQRYLKNAKDFKYLIKATYSY